MVNDHVLLFDSLYISSLMSTAYLNDFLQSISRIGRESQSRNPAPRLFDRSSDASRCNLSRVQIESAGTRYVIPDLPIPKQPE